MQVAARDRLDVDGFDAALNLSPMRTARLNLSDVTYVNVYGLVGLACCALVAEDEQLGWDLTPPRDAGVSNYLSRMGFDRLATQCGATCMLPVTSSPAHRGSAVVEVDRFSTVGDLDPLCDLLYQRLDRTGAPPEVVNALVEALWELGANTAEHSGSVGVLAAQVRAEGRGTERVELAIGDIGIGIQESFLRGGRRAPTSDHEAIELALQYLVSSVADPGRGQGMTTVVANAQELGGNVVVRTRTARRTLRAHRAARGRPFEHAIVNTSVPTLRGTIVGLSIPCQ